MKEITVENFSKENIKEWVKDFTHEDKVKFSVSCLELVSSLCSHNYPKLVVRTLDEYILDPSDENKDKCQVVINGSYSRANADSQSGDAVSYIGDIYYAAAFASRVAITSDPSDFKGFFNHFINSFVNAVRHAFVSGGVSVKSSIVSLIKSIKSNKKEKLMIKNNTIITILNPLSLVTSVEHEAYKLFEPGLFAGEELLPEQSMAMTVGKTWTCDNDGELYYLLVTPENKQFISPASAIELAPPASKYEFLEWFYDNYHNQFKQDMTRHFTIMTGKNPPDLSKPEAEKVPTPEDIDAQPGVR